MWWGEEEGREVGKATLERVKVLVGKWKRQHERGEGSWGKEEGGNMNRARQGHSWGSEKSGE